jgi:hypothetical protein
MIGITPPSSTLGKDVCKHFELAEKLLPKGRELVDKDPAQTCYTATTSLMLLSRRTATGPEDVVELNQ